MYIQRVTIENVRRFGEGPQKLDLSLPKRGWIVLAGPNGCGKTTILQSIGFTLQRTFPDPTMGLFAQVRQGATHGVTQLELAQAHDDVWTKDVELVAQHNEAAPVTIADRWKAEHGAMLHGRESLGNRAQNGPWSPTAKGWLSAGYGAERRFIGHAEAAAKWMDAESRSAGFATLFRPDASLSHPVRWLMDVHHQSLDDTRAATDRKAAKGTLESVRRILNDGLLPAPFVVEGVSSKGVSVRTADGVRDLLELSAGVQGVLALVVDLLRQIHVSFGRVNVSNGAVPPHIASSGVVLIDEPEVHLHPAWQQKLGFWLTAHFPNIQFIVATHSPFICQAAARGGLVRVFQTGAPCAAQIADDRLYRTVVNGALDEAILSALFGLAHTYSDASEALRDELAKLEAKELRGRKLTPTERKRVDELRAALPPSGLEREEQVRRRGAVRA